MRRAWPFVLALVLAACAAQREDGGLAEPVMEPVMDAPAPCVAGDDDGIGGTGCPVQ
jgi:hypothetical protein